MSFLKAEWRKLVLANYAIDEAVLQKYVPYKTEIDKWNGTCYVSLVGFMFVNTKLLGIKIPGYVNFEEVNLRFYVRYKDGSEWKRGVVFIKEIVPKYALTFVANTLYKEHYQTLPMSHDWLLLKDKRVITYEWINQKQKQSIRVNTALESQTILPGSEEEFITEHYWGYTKVNEQTTFEYEVTHPHWEHYPVHKHEIKVDFELNYGPDFAVLNHAKPTSVMLAEGSAITVEGKRKL